MKITSIDNCYENDGLMNLVGTLTALNLQPTLIGVSDSVPITDEQKQKQFIVAILPEYSDDGRLNRLNVCTDVAFPTPDAQQEALMTAVEAVVTDLQKARAEAYAKADRPITVEPLPPSRDGEQG